MSTPTEYSHISMVDDDEDTMDNSAFRQKLEKKIEDMERRKLNKQALSPILQSSSCVMDIEDAQKSAEVTQATFSGVNQGFLSFQFEHKNTAKRLESADIPCETIEENTANLCNLLFSGVSLLDLKFETQVPLANKSLHDVDIPSNIDPMYVKKMEILDKLSNQETLLHILKTLKSEDISSDSPDSFSDEVQLKKIRKCTKRLKCLMKKMYGIAKKTPSHKKIKKKKRKHSVFKETSWSYKDDGFLVWVDPKNFCKLYFWRMNVGK